MRTKSFAVIGLGVFGTQIARTLSELGHEVIAIDRLEENVNVISEEVNQAYICDVTVTGVLEDLGIKNADYIIISMGTNFEATLITALKCKEMGLSQIIVKASNPMHAKILQKIGVDRVILPEKDMAMKLAHSLSSTDIVDIIELADGYSMLEIKIPRGWVDKSIFELDIRKKYGVSIVAILSESNINVNPLPNDIFKKNDRIMVLGSNDQIKAVENAK